VCGQEGQVILTGLSDDRFGAPGRYDIVRCSHCGLEQTQPQPCEAELKELYERFYNWGGEDQSRYIRVRRRFLDSRLYWLWLKWSGDISFHGRRGSGRLLDLGCNEGRGLRFYTRNGFQAEGLEINEQADSVARQEGFIVHTAPLAEFHPERPYDVVILSNVLEHAPNPLTMLSQVRRLLAANGQVWVSCPNATSYWRRLFRRHWINWHVPFHLWHFSPATLKEVLGQAHFRVVNLETCTPALWITQSICARLSSQAGHANRWMRSAPVVAFSMLAARGLLLPWLEHTNEQMTGDCLVVKAQP
jgi:SAM-dependent methyltransferase